MIERLWRLVCLLAVAVVLIAGEAKAQDAVKLRFVLAADQLTQFWDAPAKADFARKLSELLAQEMKDRFTHWTFSDRGDTLIIQFAVKYRDETHDTVVEYRAFDAYGEFRDEGRQHPWLKPDDSAYRTPDEAFAAAKIALLALLDERMSDLDGLLRGRVPIARVPPDPGRLWRRPPGGEPELVLPLPGSFSDELKISSFNLSCDPSGDTWLNVKARGRTATIAGVGEGVVTTPLKRIAGGRPADILPADYDSLQRLPLLAIYLDQFVRPNPRFNQLLPSP